MTPVRVPTTRPTSREALNAMIEKLESAFSLVRDKAFEAFRARGERLGSDLDDWFAAERELFHFPASELTESADEVRIKAAVPGFGPEQLHVRVLPQLIVIEGVVEESANTNPRVAEGTEKEKIIFSEFSSKHLFRQFKLTQPIDADRVDAILDKGMLTIVARKMAAEPESQPVEVKINTELMAAPPTALAATAASK